MPREDANEHATRVAERIGDIYGDATLSAAALQHSNFPDVTPGDPLVLRILDEWHTHRKRCRETQPDELSRRFRQWNVSTAAVALFVIERYDHFDEALQYLDLSHRWRRDGRAPTMDQITALREQVLRVADKEEANPHNEIGRLSGYAEMAEVVGLPRYRLAFELMHAVTHLTLDMPAIEALFATLESRAVTDDIAAFGHHIEAHAGAVNWKWHGLHVILGHAVSAAKQRGLAQMTRPARTRTQIGAWGAFTVDRENEPECFSLMSRVCTNLPHATAIESDMAPTRFSKAAITLSLNLLRESTQKEELIRLHIRHRPRHGEAHARRRLAVLMESPENRSITVYTRDGHPRTLRANAKVIDFAISVHYGLALKLDHALVNDRFEANPMAPLNTGDRVEICSSDRLIHLPRAWMASLKPNEKREIRRAFRPFLISQALTLFAANYLNLQADKLAEGEYRELMNELDSTVEHYLSEHPDNRAEQRLAERAHGGTTIFAMYWLTEFAFFHEDRLNIPWTAPSRLTLNDIQAVGAIMRNRLNRHGPAATALPSQSLFNPHYFVVVAPDRDGIVFEILQTIHKHKVRIIEVVACSVHPGLAHMRITTTTASKHMVKDLVKRLRAISLRAAYLDPRMLPHADEAPLPPRPAIATVHLDDSLPVHRAVHERHFFYGRKKEVGVISAEILRIVEPASMEGGGVFINGPLKVGKSSLAQHVLMEIRTKKLSLPENTPVVIASIEASSDDNFYTLESRVLKALAYDWEQFSQKAGLGNESAPGTFAALRDLLSFKVRPTTVRPLVVIVIDEFMSLMRNMASSQAELEVAMLPFFSKLRQTPGCMLMLVGPSLGKRFLSHQMFNRLETLKDIPLSGLDKFDVKSMINREKMESHRIDIVTASQGFTDKVHEVTAGNPYWIACLLNIALRDANHHARTDLDAALVVDVVDKLLSMRPEMFNHCFMAFDSSANADEMLLFNQLLRDKIKRKAPLTFTAHEMGLTNRATLKHGGLLNQLVDAGGLIEVDNAYAVSSPILKTWLENEFEASRL